jgi:hypothetical protein
MYNDLDIHLGIDMFGMNTNRKVNTDRNEPAMHKKSFWDTIKDAGYIPSPRKPAVIHSPSYNNTPSFHVHVPNARDCGHEYEQYFTVQHGPMLTSIDDELHQFLHISKPNH